MSKVRIEVFYDDSTTVEDAGRWEIDGDYLFFQLSEGDWEKNQRTIINMARTNAVEITPFLDSGNE